MSQSETLVQDAAELDLKEWPKDRIEKLIEQARSELDRRNRAASLPVHVTLKVDAGNQRAGAKAWAKRIQSIDTTKHDGYGLIGDWLADGRNSKGRRDGQFEDALPEGSFVVACGRGGSWKNTTDAYVLLRVKADATFTREAGYQTFSGTGLELVAHSGESLTQEGLNEFPELAPAMKGKLSAIYYELRKAGL